MSASVMCNFCLAFSGAPPWYGRKPTEIKIEVVQRRNTLPINNEQDAVFTIAMTNGLCLDPGKRAQHLSVHRLRNMLHNYQLVGAAFIDSPALWRIWHVYQVI